MNLLPANLATLVEACADSKSHRLEAMKGVRVVFHGDNTYLAEATDGSCLLRVTGNTPDATEYPQLPVLESAPNGEITAVIPARDWQKAFKGLPKAAVLKRAPILANVATVFGKSEVNIGTTDLSQVNAIRSPNLLYESRFPATDNVFPSEPASFKVKVNARRLSDLLRTMLPLIEDVENKVTIEFRKDTSPIAITANGPDGQKAIALIMPLS